MTPRLICKGCYEKHGATWSKTGWTKHCSGGKALKCPIELGVTIISPYPPPWCENRKILTALKVQGWAVPSQAMVERER